MNKVILFYPSFVSGNEQKTLYVDVPLSVVALAQSLHGSYEVEIIDERLDADYADQLQIRLAGVFVVGISATTSNQIINGLEFAKRVRDYNKKITIVWGGWHASLMPYETIKHELVDVIILGQGDIIWKQLVQGIESGDISKVNNIVYKTEDYRVVANERKQFKNLQLPVSMIDGYRYIDLNRYIHKGWGNERILGYESSRGCPFSCSFCSISAVFQSKWYGIPAVNLVNDIQYLVEKYQIDAIHFFDNNFFVDRKRARDTASELCKRHVNIRWDGTIVIRQFLDMSEQEIQLLKDSGFYRIIVGIESGDEGVLRKINKVHKNEEVLLLVEKCKKYGIRPSLSFMIGFPWNPEEDTKNTLALIEKIKKINSDTEILLFEFSPYLGTPLYEVAQQYDMKFPDSLEGWANFTYDKQNTNWISKKLQRRIERYLSFFGTKNMTEDQKIFVQGFEQKK